MSPDPTAAGSPAASGSELLVVGGRSGVGKTAVANELHAMLVADDVRHAVIDGDALDLAWPRPWEHRLSMRNLAAVWANYRDLGYRRLVYVNTVAVLEAQEIAAAMGDDPHVTGVLLRAGDVAAQHRLVGREVGDELTRHLARSADMAVRLDAAESWVHRVDTDELDRREVAEHVRTLVGW